MFANPKPDTEEFRGSAKIPAAHVISRKARGVTGAVIGPGLFDQLVELAGFGVGLDLLVPHFLAQFIKPFSHGFDFAGFEFYNGRFNFLNRTHGKRLASSIDSAIG